MTIGEAQGLVDGWIMSCANISQSKLLTSFLKWGGILLMLYPPHGGILLLLFDRRYWLSANLVAQDMCLTQIRVTECKHIYKFQE